MPAFPPDDLAVRQMLVVRDLARSKAWYLDVLGASLYGEERGAEFLTSPVESGPETRAFFRDPDGHLFEISEFRAGSPAS